MACRARRTPALQPGQPPAHFLRSLVSTAALGPPTPAKQQQLVQVQSRPLAPGGGGGSAENKPRHLQPGFPPKGNHELNSKAQARLSVGDSEHGAWVSGVCQEPASNQAGR